MYLDIIYTSHCCPCFAAVDVLGIGIFLRNMAHMSNMFLVRKVGLNIVNEHRCWLSLHGAYSRPANQSHVSGKKYLMELGSSN